MYVCIRFFIAVLFCFLFFHSDNCAQQLPVNLRFNKLTTENGLSDNYTYDIIKDKQGYLWIATQNGLNRFDGVEFKTFFHNPDDNNSLLNNYIRFVVEDSLGRIWAATAFGLSVYNPSTGKFWNYIPPVSKYKKSRVYRVLKSHDGSIWFSTKNHLSTIDLNNFNITSYRVDTTERSEDGASIDFFAEDHNGDFWFDSYMGLCLFDRQTHKIKVMDKGYGLSSFYDGGNDECWIGSWFHGLRNYNFTTKRFTDYFFEIKHDSVVTRDISSIEKINYAGLESYLWIGTDNELAVFDTRTKSFVKYYNHSATLSTSLPSGFIDKVFYDGRNELWIANAHGLYYARLNQLAFQTYIFPEMKTSEVNRIRQDVSDSSCLRVGLFPGGIFKLNKYSGEISEQFIPEKKIIYGYNYILDFIDDGNNKFWMTNHNGLASFDIKTKKFRVLSGMGRNFQSADSLIYSIILNADSTFWFASNTGLGLFNMKTESFTYYPHYKDEKNSAIKSHTVGCLMKDFTGNIWLATQYEGLLLFNSLTKEFRRMRMPGEDETMSTAHDIIQSADSSIWYTTGEKVFYMKPDEKLFTQMHCEKLNGTIFNLASDRNSNLYLGTQSGLVEYEKATRRFIKYTTTDGLYDNRLYEGFDFGNNGELYMRGIGYLTIINIAKLRKEYLPASLTIESLKIDSRDSVIDFAQYINKPLLLRYKQNQFTVNFRLLNFEDAQMVNYSYMLEGWDKDWISSGTGNYASYSNLLGGDYTLHIKAINPDGAENPQQATLMIHIDTPYWQTIWFRVLIAFAVASVIYFIYRQRIQRLLAVARVRGQISRDLHDEIGASLSSAQIMSAFAEESIGGNSPDAKRWVNKIGINNKEMMEKIRDIVWTLNSSKEISGDIITRMNQYIAQTLEPKDIVCNFTADEKVNDALNDFVRKRNVYLIFKEAVNNIAKYSSAAEVTIALKIENKKLLLNIADNGVGFETASPPTLLQKRGEQGGNGLNNMRKRAEQIHASLEIISSADKGTVVTLLMPLPHLRYRFFKNVN